MPNFRMDRSIMKVFFSVVVCLFVTGFSQFALAQAPQPHFKVDPYWPKELPNNWIIGQVGGLYVAPDVLQHERGGGGRRFAERGPRLIAVLDTVENVAERDVFGMSG